MSKIAFLFPGQGSQFIGMGSDIYEKHSFIRKVFSTAEQVSDINIKKLCFEGPIDELTRTINLQPAITAVNLAFLSIIEKEGIKPFVAAGHSLGEFSAIRAAKIITTKDCFRLVFKRGELMHRESLHDTGTMQAIIGLDYQIVQDIVRQVAKSEGTVSIANHNTLTQIVITGKPEPVKKAAQMASEIGGKTIPLKVSGAWHSNLIKGAEQDFVACLNSIPFNTPQCLVVHNVTADTTHVIQEMKTLISRQLLSQVKWYDSIQWMIRAKVDTFVEIGPGKILTGLLKKILPTGYKADLFNVNDIESLENFINNFT